MKRKPLPELDLALLGWINAAGPVGITREQVIEKATRLPIGVTRDGIGKIIGSLALNGFIDQEADRLFVTAKGAALL
jgi:hypothetical protein